MMDTEQLIAEPCYPDAEETPLAVHLRSCQRCAALWERWVLQRLGVECGEKVIA